MNKYIVYTTATVSNRYTVVANSEEEAEEKFFSGEYEDYQEDLDWCGDSSEEVYKVEKAV